MSTATYNMTIPQGTDFTLNLIFEDGFHKPIDMTTGTFSAAIKRSYECPTILLDFSISKGTVEVPAMACHRGIKFMADTVGTVGNSIALVFDGHLKVYQVVTAWNLANPNNQVHFCAHQCCDECPESCPYFGCAGDDVFPAMTLILSAGGTLSNSLVLSLTAEQTATLPVAKFMGPGTPNLILYWDLLQVMSGSTSRPLQGQVYVSPQITE